MYEVLLQGGMVVDGTGREPYRADVAIERDRITVVGNVGRAEVGKRLDVSGLTIAPGFVDIHSHTDVDTLRDGRALSKIMQGCTTEVSGNCGGSGAPVAEGSALESVRREGFPVTWRTYGEYAATIEKHGSAVNLAPLVGHGNLRRMVIGDEDKEVTPRDLQEMKMILIQALDDGAFGMSSGMEYHPGMFAGVGELSELCSALAFRQAFYASHIRNEGPSLIESVKEQIAAVEKSRCALEISHLKAVGPDNWGKLRQAVSVIEEACAKGLDVTYDLYPYTASSTSLSIVLPVWAHDGGKEAIVARLKNPDTRAQIYSEATERTLRQGGWERIVVTAVYTPENKRFEGMSLTDIAGVLGKDPCETAFDILIADTARTGIIRHAMCDEDLAYGIKHPLGMVCSDGSALNPDNQSGGKVHPRHFGAFPRLLAKYVREDRLLPIGEAVKKITLQPARRAGIAARGSIAPGYFADITIFDAARIRDTATFAEPFQLAEGIIHVFVNGVPVVQNSRHTGALPGRALKKGVNR